MRKREEVWIEFEGTIEHQTDRAFLFWRNGDDKPQWVPKSQSQLVEPSSPDHPAVIKLTKWIAEQKGWA